MNHYKVILVGDGCVGKTSFCDKHISDTVRQEYIPTLGVNVHPIVLNTSHGDVCLDIWDVAGQEKFGGLRQGYYQGGNAAIVMFDVTNQASFENIHAWILDIKKVCNDIPIVVLGNKVDITDKKVNPEDISPVIQKYQCTYYYVSTKTNYNLEKPFLSILRYLKKDEELHLCKNKQESTKEEDELYVKPSNGNYIPPPQQKVFSQLIDQIISEVNITLLKLRNLQESLH